MKYDTLPSGQGEVLDLLLENISSVHSLTEILKNGKNKYSNLEQECIMEMVQMKPLTEAFNLVSGIDKLLLKGSLFLFGKGKETKQKVVEKVTSSVVESKWMSDLRKFQEKL